MASRKEQKEALRREREAREQAAREAEHRRRLIGYAAGAGLVLVAIIAVVALLAGGGSGGSKAKAADVFPTGGSVPARKIQNLSRAAAAAGCKLQSVRATARMHTTNPAEGVRYSTNPPTSGRHYQIPADDGVYSKAPTDTQLVHPLEHGRVDIWVRPSAPNGARKTVRAIFDKEQGYQLLLVPRPNMPYELAATAWNRDPQPNGTGRLLGCPRVTPAAYDALRAFIDEHRGNGPEAIP